MSARMWRRGAAGPGPLRAQGARWPRAWSRDADFENVVVSAGDDQHLRAHAGVDDLAGRQRLQPGHGQASVLAAGGRVRAGPAPAAVRLVVHVLVHRQPVALYPAICRRHSR